MTSSEMLTRALAAAARGWHVFPLLPESKRPARPDHRAQDCARTDPWCRAGHAGWEHRATTDADRIRRAWSSSPCEAGPLERCGLGIATGPSGLVVIDLDVAKPDETAPDQWLGFTTGAEVLEHLAEWRGARITPTYTVRTISGGRHLYYQAPAAASFGNTVRRIGWLIDTRAAGGYVVAPPTIIADARYEVTDDRPAVELPSFLTDLLRSGRTGAEPSQLAAARPPRSPAQPLRHASAYVGAALRGEVGRVAAAQVGERNHLLFCASVALGQLVAGGALAEATAHDALMDAATPHISAGAFTIGGAEATIASGFQTGAREPRKAA